MNRKECEKALEMLKEYAIEMVEDENLDGEIFYEWYHLNEEELRQYTAPLEKLIEEHFDNPPLKFDELKEENIYWDNHCREWVFIKKKEGARTIYLTCFAETGLFKEGFEENRFYRKQVEE